MLAATAIISQLAHAVCPTRRGSPEEQAPNNNGPMDFDKDDDLTPAKTVVPTLPGIGQQYRMDDSEEEAPSATSMVPVYADSNRGTPTPVRRDRTEATLINFNDELLQQDLQILAIQSGKSAQK